MTDCVLGGTGPMPIRAVFLKTKFDALPPWVRANVVYILRDIVRADLSDAFNFHLKVARAVADQEKRP